MRFTLVSALLILTLPFTSIAKASDWSSTSAGYRVGEKFHEPGIEENIRKEIYSLSHVSGYKYGKNFFNVDVFRSGNNDPANNGGGGAQEIYVVYRHHLNLSKTTQKDLSWRFIKDINFTFGIDFNSKNNAFASRVKKVMLGPTVDLTVPGFLSIGVYYRTETNHNGIVGKTDNFNPTYQIAAAWSTPINSAHAKFKGFVNIVGKKGQNAFGNNTKIETLSRMYLLFDVGRYAVNPKTFYLGLGYEYWTNKYGNASSIVENTRAPMLAAEIYF